jgi:hypothetical protein
MTTKERTRGRPKTRPETTHQLWIELDDETATALERFLDAQLVRPPKTAVGVKAMRSFLREQGFIKG